MWDAEIRRVVGEDGAVGAPSVTVVSQERCTGTLVRGVPQLIVVIDDPAVTRRVLHHLGLPTEVPDARPARAPPVPLLDGSSCIGHAPDDSTAKTPPDSLF